MCNEFKRDKSKTLVFTWGSAGFTTWKASPVRPGWCLVLTRSGIPDYEPDGNANLEYTTRNLSLPAATYRQRQSAFEKFVGKVATTLRLGDLTPTTGGTSVTISAYIDRNKGEASQTIVAPASLGTYITPLPKSLSRDAEERLIKEASRSAGVEVLPVEEVVKRMPHENDKTDNETPKVRAWLTSQGSTRAPVVYKTVESGEFRMSWPISEDAAVLSFPIVIVDGSWHPTTGSTYLTAADVR